MTTSTITSKGQTTIPRAVRSSLGLEPQQQVSYEVKQGYVILRPTDRSLDRFAGSLKSKRPAASKVEERRVAGRVRGAKQAPTR